MSDENKKGIDLLKEIPDDMEKMNELIKREKAKGIGFKWNKRVRMGAHDGSTSTVHINPRHRTPSTVSHEYGHAEIAKGNCGKFLKSIQDSKIPKEIRYFYKKHSTAASSIHGGAGFAAGLYNGSREDKKDESKALKWGTRILPTAAYAPILLYEGAASIKGHKLLKEIGLSKKARKLADKHNLLAFGTYTTTPLRYTVDNEIGYQLGKLAGKQVKKHKNKSKED